MTLSRKQLSQLKLLRICPKNKRKNLLKKISNSCIKAICECSLNTLHGNIPLSPQQKKNLSKHKVILRKLSDRKKPIFQKRRLIIQKGGSFLSLLLPVAISAISGLIK